MKTVYVLGRRGPAQAAFTNPEIKELGELEAADIVVDSAELELDEASRAMVEIGRRPDSAEEPRYPGGIRQPGTGHQGPEDRDALLRLTDCARGDRPAWSGYGSSRTAWRTTAEGASRPVPTGEEEVIPAGLVFRSVGYRGVALPGVPFDERRGVIPNEVGRVCTADGTVCPGVYAAGWIKRGPSGVIGTNKPDAVETMEQLLTDHDAGNLPTPEGPDAGAIVELLRSRGVSIVTYADWQRLDALELAAGRQARPPSRQADPGGGDVERAEAERRAGGPP